MSSVTRARKGQVARGAPGPARVAKTDARERILEVFSAKAKRSGLRSLLMTELATELRMSAATLYKLYPSKEALALACVDRWADELGAAEAAKRDSDPSLDGFERYLRWIDAWADANAEISPAFSHDLRADYPAVWQRYRDVLDDRKRLGAALLRPLLKRGLDERVAFAVLDTIFSTVIQPAFAEHLKVSRREALRVAVTIWAGGALAREGKLRSLSRSTKPIANSRRNDALREGKSRLRRR
jgi:AcrR family transcriptional regulator